MILQSGDWIKTRQVTNGAVVITEIFPVSGLIGKDIDAPEFAVWRNDLLEVRREPMR